MQNETQFDRIFYYWRHAMYGHISVLCQQSMKNGGMSPFYLIWNALAMGAQGKTGQGIEILQKIGNKIAMGLPIAVAELEIHKRAQLQDFTAIGELEASIPNLKAQAAASAIVQAAQILWLCGEEHEAMEYITPLTQASPANKEAIILTGWISLSHSDRNSGRWFDMAGADTAFSRGPDPSVIYGKAMYFVNMSRWQDSLQNLVQVAGISNFPESAIERARIYIAMSNWDLAIEAASEARGHLISDCEPLLLTCIHSLAFKGDLESSRSQVKELCTIISQYESDNAAFIVKIVRLLTSLSWNDKSICESCFSLIKPLAKHHNENAEFMTVYGRLLLDLEKAAEAQEAFQSAIIADNGSAAAMSGLIASFIEQKKMIDAHNQLEFFEAVAAGQEPAELLLSTTKARYARLANLPHEGDAVIHAMKKHLDSVSAATIAPVGGDGPTRGRLPLDKFLQTVELLRLDDFSAALAEAMFECNTLERTVADPRNGPVCDIIARALDFAPGSVPFSYFLAVLAFGEGRYAQATTAIQAVLNSHWGYNASQCHLLLAQIRLQMKQFDEAEAALNRAVSFDFGIRSSLTYCIIIAQLNEARGQFEKALGTIEELQRTVEYIQAPQTEKTKVTIFQSKVLRKMGRGKESLTLVEEALVNATTSEDQGTLTLYKSGLLASLDRARDGIAILEAVEPSSAFFTAARKKAAKIYLKNLNDKVMYVKCFKSLVDKQPSKTNFMMYGDALIKVKRFNDAVENFRQAIENDPSDEVVANHLAKSLMIVHDYSAAIEAYQHAVSVSTNIPKAQLELCRALVKLRRFEEARDAASDAMAEIDGDSNDWEGQFILAQYNELMWDIDMKTDEESGSDFLQETLNLYDRLAAPSRVDIPADASAEIKARGAALNLRAGAIYNEHGDSDGAADCYSRAAELDPKSTKALLALARVQNERGDIDRVKETCQQLMKLDPSCEDAVLMLAEVSDAASIENLEETFSQTPTFYRTLVRLVEMSARAGALDKVPGYLSKTPEDSPGSIFCRALYKTYIGAPQDALQLFHKIRSDPDWGQEALIMMFYIYINPSRKIGWCEEKPLATPKELDAARKMLNRIDDYGVDKEQLEAAILLSENTTDSVKKALEMYKGMDDGDLAVTMGLCKCYIRLGQQREATRLLNSIVNGSSAGSDVSAVVEANLMMAVISIKEDSLDEAERYITRANELDQSCVKGWELMAQIYEKQKRPLDTAEALERAWELTSKSDFVIGYKLALNFMKGQRPVDAIKVARYILSKHPNYPKIKDQILIPCVSQLRS